MLLNPLRPISNISKFCLFQWPRCKLSSSKESGISSSERSNFRGNVSSKHNGTGNNRPRSRLNGREIYKHNETEKLLHNETENLLHNARETRQLSEKERLPQCSGNGMWLHRESYRYRFRGNERFSNINNRLSQDR